MKKNEQKDKSKLDQEKLEILDQLADFVVKRKLDIIAVFMIESTRPLHYLGAQAVIFFEPFLNIIFDNKKILLFREAMEESQYVDYLLDRIEYPPQPNKTDESQNQNANDKK